MTTFESHGNFMYGKVSNKHINEWKYKFHSHNKRLHLSIWELYYRWGSNNVFLKIIFFLEGLVKVVCIWPKRIVDEIIDM